MDTSFPEVTRLKMVCERLEDVPRIPFPESLALRWYQPGDETVWFEIQARADRWHPITPDLFCRQFGNDPALLAQRQAYLCDSTGRPIGTATAWFKSSPADPVGRIHWVAIVPEYQGRGFSKPLLSVVCHRLRELGHSQACLTTSIERIPAIQLYRRFGFVPLIENETDKALWQKVGVIPG